MRLVRFAVCVFSLCVAGVAAAAAPGAPAPAAQPQWKHFPSRPAAPPRAPNVLLIMTDDVGYGASSTFGGPIPTPTFEALAKRGLRYTQFHTAAMCSPTRAALLTGRNHHSVGFGVIAEVSTDAPGYDAYIPRNSAVVARVLKDHGYDTAWFGKNHNTPPWQATVAGPFDQWPNGMGFDYFYGFNVAMTNQFAPQLTENRTAVEPPRDPGYILDKDLADHAIAWLRNQRNLGPDHPFFLYYAPGSSHAPHHAPRAAIDRFRGQFTQGWDQQREATFARQKMLGVIPSSAELTPRPAQIPAWTSLTSDQKRVATGLMQVYAATLSYADEQIGRVIEELRASGQLDNTLVIYIQGDNGASAEDLHGTTDDLAALGGIEGDYGHMLSRLDDLGGPKTYENYPVGWAWSMNTPFQWAKQVASHLGGTRNGMVVSWPGHIDLPGGTRDQFHHVTDIVPTILEAAGIKAPAVVDGVKQAPLAGVSLLYTLQQPGAPSRHRQQYFELMGNRAYYDNGWMASTTPARMPWSHTPGGEDASTWKWELYDLSTDYSQAHDLAARMPAKLAELRARFMEAARRYNVLPIDSNFLGRVDSTLRPSATRGRTEFSFYPSRDRYPAAAIPDLGRRWRIEADVVTASGASGMVVVRGDWFAGWGLQLNEGRPLFTYRASDQPRHVARVVAPAALPPGAHRITVDVSLVDAGPTTQLVLSVDGREQARAIAERSGFFTGDLFVGRAGYVPLVDGDALPLTFGGDVEKVVLKPLRQ
ncbi:MAG: arylsulfatase [Steroidobacteraceae bacterium]